MSLSNSPVLEWDHALEIVVPVIFTNLLILVLKKAANEQIYDFLFISILVATFILWLIIVSHISGLSVILIFVSMMAGLINTAFLEMIEKKVYLVINLSCENS